MEEDESIDTDFDSVHITKNSAKDMVSEEETPIDTEMVAERESSTDAEIDSAHATTVLPSPHFAQVQAPSSPVSPMTPLEMYHAMKEQLQMQPTPRLTHDRFGMSIPGTRSTVDSNNGNTIMYRHNMDVLGSTALPRGLFAVNLTAKRTRDMFEEGEDDQGTEMGGSGPPKRMKLVNVKMEL